MARERQGAEQVGTRSMGRHRRLRPLPHHPHTERRGASEKGSAAQPRQPLERAPPEQLQRFAVERFRVGR
eukprot:7851387-Alexandrium_andersonii.AAC.1